jgi:hypothetical protein
MISFLPGGEWLALAGLAAAAGPVLIHLLNRRIFRRIDWAAMDFLLEASRRSKAFLRLRDLLLMALRMAAVALFGFAVARPFLSTGGAAATSGPVHAILVLDNSMSMGRERLGGATLLDDARARAAEFIEQLPTGSRISVLPLCGSPTGTSLDAYRVKEDALEAVAAVPVDLPPLNEATSGARIPGGRNQGRARNATRKGGAGGGHHPQASRGRS